MNSLPQRADQFAEYVRQRTSAIGQVLGIDELFDEWRLAHPDPDEFHQNVEAINASIADYQRGVEGTPAGEDSEAIRREFGLTDE